MQFIDLGRQQKRIRAAIDIRIAAVLDHGSYIMGPEVEELEARLCAFTGARHCVSCASGTDALLMALMAWKIGPGDAVFVPAFTFFATAEVVSLLGATPVPVDIDPATFTMRPQDLERAVKAVRACDASLHPLPIQARERALQPRAVIPVDLFGLPAPYGDILPLAERHGLMVLEDAAQSFGAEHNGRKTCALGCQASATSFFPAKPLGCYGDGGALFTDDDAFAEILRSLRVHGKGADKYDNTRIGINGRMDTLQAAILLAKLDIFAEELAFRQALASLYHELLSPIPGVTPPYFPGPQDGRSSVWAQYCISVEGGRRDALVARLKGAGIPVNIYYPKPLHMLEALRHLGYAANDLPSALEASRRVLALPFHPYMTEAETRAVARAVQEGMRV